MAGFNIKIVLGFLFIFFGLLSALSLLNINIAGLELNIFGTVTSWVVTIGSIIGGIFIMISRSGSGGRFKEPKTKMPNLRI